MKQNLLWLLIALATAAQGASSVAAPSYPPELKPAQEQAEAAHLAAGVLSRYHYKALPLDEALSAKIFDRYLKSLDAEKFFFVQADIDRLSPNRSKLGTAILEENLTVPFAIFNLYERRVTERFDYARALLKKGFDFGKQETYQASREKEAWAKSEADMNELWRKRVKNDWLRLKLAGMADKSIAAILDKRYDTFQKRLGQMKSADAFQTYMNAYTTAIEPHTNYLGARAVEDFDISMRLSLVGIGAVLAQSDEYAIVRELVPGGPALLSGQLAVGDRIVGVAQGEGGKLTDILGWRLDEAVALIRGAPDSVVLLDVLPADAGPDGKHKLVSLVRKTISLEQQAAKAAIHSVSDGTVTRRVGVITLPTFYEDFAGRQKGARDYRSATRDVARLLAGFRKEKVDGVLIDLRNNTGGSLTEAVDLTGLFIDKGPVVQQRNAGGRISVESDRQAGVDWDGPLGVLINRSSASASEIFAAALQDYGRALIVGEPSFGKGTVQTMINLDQVARNSKPQFGQLKMTVAQFFRINGGTTQLRGVKPDIVLPGIADAENFGESSFDNALPWSEVKAADYVPAGDVKALLPALLSLHEARVRKDPDFQELQEEVAEINLQRKKNAISLNEAERRKERDLQDARLAAREARRETGKDVSKVARSTRRDDGLQADERNFANEMAAEKARKDAKDVLLNEALQILGDQAGMLANGARIAAGAGPRAQPVPD